MSLEESLMHTKKRWMIKKNETGNSALNMEKLSLNPIIYRILANRGIKDINSIKEFLNPDIHKLYDPYLLPDMEEAVEKIKYALSNDKKITIYGDYDADGVTSTSILYRCFKKLNANINYYIPNRMDEGYGLSIDAIDSILSNNTDLIITVDCGITSIDEVRYCKDHGVDIIITDHHECKEVLPDTIVINAKRQDSTYPFKELSGAGIAFKLVGALSKFYHEIDIKDFLDLAAIGTIADVVPLIDENRIIVKYGLEAMSYSGKPGLTELLNVCGISQYNINSGQISFTIAPRINAAGRIADASVGVELFICEDHDIAVKLSEQLNEGNKKRQDIEEQILIEAEEKISSDPNQQEALVYVLDSSNWHVGVIGIVASKLVDKYYKPVIMLTGDGEVYRGSARSIPGFNIFEALSRCSDLLLKYGGHELAAGLSLGKENLQEFMKRMNQIAREKLTPDKLIPSILIDCEIKHQDITLELIEELKLLEPFGMGNPSPVFVYRSCVIEDIKTVGVQNKHLKMRIKDSTETFDAIAFNMGDIINQYSRDDIVDVVCTLKKNTWNGMDSVQLVIKDIHPSVFKKIEYDYYKSLKKFIESLAGTEDILIDNAKNFLMESKTIEDVIKDVKGKPNCLILLCRKDLVEQVLESQLDFKILFRNFDGYDGQKPVVIINPEFDSIKFDSFSDVYIMDNLVNYEYIKNGHVADNKDITLHICCKDIEMDTEFIKSLKPSRQEMEKVYKYIRDCCSGGFNRNSVIKISGILELNIFTVYNCLRTLNEAGIIQINKLKNNELLFRINSHARSNIQNTNSMKKFDYIVYKLNKIYKYFHNNKGE